MSTGRDATAAMTVAEVLSTFPHAAVVFEVVGIDMCCGQAETLAAASSAALIDVHEVIDLVDPQEVVPIPAPGPDASLSELTRYVVLHFHRRARAILVELTELSRRTGAGHSSPGSWDMRDAIDQLVRELVPHMRYEERYHFRYIDSMLSHEVDRQMLVPLYGTLTYPLQALKHDHSRDVTAMSDLRSITSDFTPPAGSCERVIRLYELLAFFENELKEHVQIEDDTLFPRALETEQQLG